MNTDPVGARSLQRLPNGAPDARRPAPPVPPPASTGSAPGADSMHRAAASANRALVEKGRELTFEFDDDVDRVIVKLIDRKTGEVLRQMPSAELVEIARALHAETAGALLRADA